MTTYYQQVHTGEFGADGHTVVDDGGGSGPGRLYTSDDIYNMVSEHGDPLTISDDYGDVVSELLGSEDPRHVWYQGERPVTVPTLDEAVARLRESAAGWGLSVYDTLNWAVADDNPYDVPFEGRVFASVDLSSPSEPVVISVDVPSNDEDGVVNIELGRVPGLLSTVWLDFVEGEKVLAITGLEGSTPDVHAYEIPFDEDGDPDTDAVEEYLREQGYEVVGDWNVYQGGLNAWAFKIN